MATLQHLLSAGIRAYFEMSYWLLTGSDEGRRFLELAAPIPGAPAHGYATADDLAALIRDLEPDASTRLMDLGCGVGGIAFEVSRRTGASVIGIDHSTRAIATARAAASGAMTRASFRRGSIRRPPPVGASGVYALDSLMFARVDADLLRGIGDVLEGPRRLFATSLAYGPSARDPVVVAAAAIGLSAVTSDDVTEGLVARSQDRRRIARHLLRPRPHSLRGLMAMTLVMVEESLVQHQVRAGRLRRWRTVIELHRPT